jgi:hypothetical protein
LPRLSWTWTDLSTDTWIVATEAQDEETDIGYVQYSQSREHASENEGVHLKQQEAFQKTIIVIVRHSSSWRRLNTTCPVRTKRSSTFIPRPRPCKRGSTLRHTQPLKIFAFQIMLLMPSQGHASRGRLLEETKP